MAKFNTSTTRPATFSPVQSEPVPAGSTYEGAPGYARDVRSELFLLAVSNMVAEDTFYEDARTRDSRYAALVRQLAVSDPDWVLAFLRWLRRGANMRSASLVGAAEFAKGRLDAGKHGCSRQAVDAVCQRADEPGEVLAYWTSQYGRAIPKPVKRGVADAAVRLFDERSLLKWDSSSRGFRFADVVEMTHPVKRSQWQGDLFQYMLDERHGSDNGIPESLAMVRERAALGQVPVEQRREILRRDPERLARAGITWEALAGWLQGPMDAEAWQAVLPHMGIMARIRNLRNLDNAGVSDAAVQPIIDQLSDPEAIAKSRQLPMRFLSAYRNAPSLRWSYPLERALNFSLANVPVLSGRTLVLVDRSGSMFSSMSRRSDLSQADVAAIFGTAVALRCEQADLVEFGTHSARVNFSRGESVLKVLERFHSMGGTQTASAVREHYQGQDRVVLVTDEQVWGGWRGEEPLRQIPDHVPAYTWNLVGYQYGHGESGSRNRHAFGGLSDQAFKMIPLIEAGKNADWDAIFADRVS